MPPPPPPKAATVAVAAGSQKTDAVLLAEERERARKLQDTCSQLGEELRKVRERAVSGLVFLCIS